MCRSLRGRWQAENQAQRCNSKCTKRRECSTPAPVQAASIALPHPPPCTLPTRAAEGQQSAVHGCHISARHLGVLLHHLQNKEKADSGHVWFGHCFTGDAATTTPSRRQAGTVPPPGRHQAGTVPPPGRHQAGTRPAPGRHPAATRPALCRHPAATRPHPAATRPPHGRHQAATRPPPGRHQAATRPPPGRHQAATRPPPHHHPAGTRPPPGRHQAATTSPRRRKSTRIQLESRMPAPSQRTLSATPLIWPKASTPLICATTLWSPAA